MGKPSTFHERKEIRRRQLAKRRRRGNRREEWGLGPPSLNHLTEAHHRWMKDLIQRSRNGEFKSEEKS